MPRMNAAPCGAWGGVAWLGAAVCIMFAISASGARAEPPATAAARLPVPTQAQQDAARKTIHTLYASEFRAEDPAARRKLAQRLLSDGQATHDLPAARFVLFSEAQDLACQAGAIDVALAALDAQADAYECDRLASRARLFEQAARQPMNKSDPAAAEALARGYLELLEACVRRERFELGDAAVGPATAAIRQVKSTAFYIHAQQSVRDYATLRDLCRAAQGSVPGDAAGWRAAGIYHAFVRGDWAKGLPELARGPKDALQAAAALELAAGAGPQEGVKAADAWWDAAGDKTLPQLIRKACRDHARQGYQKAEAAITGLTLTRIRARLATGDAPEGVGSAADGGAMVRVASIDLLKDMDVAAGTVAGSWARMGSGIACESTSHARLQLPYHPPADYDLAVDFTRTAGAGPIVLLLAREGHAFGVELDARGNTARLELVDGKINSGNPTVARCAIETGKKYRALVEVRQGGVRVLLDGAVLLSWQGDYHDLTRYGSWKLKDEACLGVGASSAAVEFHSVQVTEHAAGGRSMRNAPGR